MCIFALFNLIFILSGDVVVTKMKVHLKLGILFFAAFFAIWSIDDVSATSNFYQYSCSDTDSTSFTSGYNAGSFVPAYYASRFYNPFAKGVVGVSRRYCVYNPGTGSHDCGASSAVGSPTTDSCRSATVLREYHCIPYPTQYEAGQSAGADPRTFTDVTCAGSCDTVTDTCVNQPTTPPIVSLSASSLNIPQGGSTFLTWSVSGIYPIVSGTYPCSWTSGLSGALNPAVDSTVSYSSSGGSNFNDLISFAGAHRFDGRQVFPPDPDTTIYTLSCTGPGGTQSSSVTVNVVQAAPTVSLTASPSTVSAGQASTLSWTSTNLVGAPFTCSLTGGGWTAPSPLNFPSGSTPTPSLSSTTTFTLSCSNSAGPAQSSTTVTVSGQPPGPWANINANPANLPEGGGNTVISWSSGNAGSCTASSSPSAPGWSGAKALSGSQSVSISQTTQFNINCGGAVASRTVNVATAPAGAITSAQWSLVDGSAITTSYVNQTVRLKITSSLISRAVRFSILERDPLNNDDITGGSPLLATTDDSGNAQVDWFISDAVMTAASDGGLEYSGSDNDAVFYFNVSSTVPSTSLLSSDLTVQNIEGPNNPPKAVITGPRDKGIYFVNTPILFNQSSTDAQGTSGLTYRWTIAEDSFEKLNANFTHTFTSAGQKTITLRVTDSEGERDESQVSVLVIASPGALAYISSPGHTKVIPAQPNGQLQVMYNGSEGYVINSVGSGCPTVTCLAGSCPVQTENVPASCTGETNLAIQNRGTNLAFTNTAFTWNFGDGVVYVNRSGVGNASGTKFYGSSYAGEKIIELIMDYRDASVAANGRSQRSFVIGQCVPYGNGKAWIPINENGRAGMILDTDDRNGACVGTDGASGTSDDCCIAGWVCGDDDTTGSTPYRCHIPPNTDINRCQDYEQQGACINDTANIVELDPAWNPKGCGQIVNGQIIDCSCAWNATAVIGNQCFLNSNGTSIDNPNEAWSCSSTYTQSQCTNGYMTLDITAIFNPGTSGITAQDASCQSGPLPVPCGRPIVELSFFDYRQIISAIVIIALIYFIIARSRTRKR